MEAIAFVFVNPHRWLFPMDLLERVGWGETDRHGPAAPTSAQGWGPLSPQGGSNH